MSGYGARPEIDRFNEKFVIDSTTNCWNWIGKPRDDGYCLFSVGSKKDGSMHDVYAHRWSYEHFIGDIPDGYTIDHKCRNRRCVNPNHLEAVTNIVNVMRGNSIPALNARKLYCKHGHPLDDANTYTYKDRQRHCRICHALSEQAQRDKRKPSEYDAALSGLRALIGR